MTSLASKKADAQVLFNYVFNAFVNGWIIMLLLGGLGHQLSLPRLFVGYWTAVLIEVLAECLFSPGATVGPYMRKIIDLQARELK